MDVPRANSRTDGTSGRLDTHAAATAPGVRVSGEPITGHDRGRHSARNHQVICWALADRVLSPGKRTRRKKCFLKPRALPEGFEKPESSESCSSDSKRASAGPTVPWPRASQASSHAQPHVAPRPTNQHQGGPSARGLPAPPWAQSPQHTHFQRPRVHKTEASHLIRNIVSQ